MVTDCPWNPWLSENVVAERIIMIGFGDHGAGADWSFFARCCRWSQTRPTLLVDLTATPCVGRPYDDVTGMPSAQNVIPEELCEAFGGIYERSAFRRLYHQPVCVVSLPTQQQQFPQWARHGKCTQFDAPHPDDMAARYVAQATVHLVHAFGHRNHVIVVVVPTVQLGQHVRRCLPMHIRDVWIRTQDEMVCAGVVVPVAVVWLKVGSGPLPPLSWSPPPPRRCPSSRRRCGATASGRRSCSARCSSTGTVCPTTSRRRSPCSAAGVTRASCWRDRPHARPNPKSQRSEGGRRRWWGCVETFVLTAHEPNERA